MTNYYVRSILILPTKKSRLTRVSSNVTAKGLPDQLLYKKLYRLNLYYVP
nr:MAG TPA: hypothetical protein [Bacteriophage sp.]